ncbi:glycoside hydrolase family 5 protein [Schizophyllum amplum]|uniref:Glycoside hydrolase family 5 protein n=1 Tax=Schizophyllum amplum TaxID=97359 RepID=A0A550CN37_9AGAR|nr:glycoside hydrolase family 5 protein [Auriculariopsis ampla]
MASVRAALALSLFASSLAISPGFNYGADKVRGVNLGGWLVLEPWITPSLFDATGNDGIVDEYTFCAYQDRDAAASALYNHWNTFITEDDFAQIAAAGLNHVRLPIGYWAFDVGDEPYIQGQIEHLNNAVDWASIYGLKVIVDLHGVPGSQNGFDNSGQRMNYPTWHTSQSNIDRSNAVIKTLADMFKDRTDTVTIIAPLNEPAGFQGSDVLSAVRQFWRDSYGNIRFPYGSGRESNTVELIHDAFQDLSYWNGFMTPHDFEGVAMDTHIYTIFSDSEAAMSFDEHVSTVCNKASSLANFDLWTIVGEWTPAYTDCARYLNGRGIGARYDGSYSGSPYVGSCSGMTGTGNSFSDDYKGRLRAFWEAQVITYEKGEGWIMWTWKAEGAEEWAYQAGLYNGWIPWDPTAIQNPNICG